MRIFSGIFLPLFLSLFVLAGCTSKKQESSTMNKELFGRLSDGTEVYVYTLKNSRGMEARITNYGGILISLKVPDKTGQTGDVVLGYDSLSRYVAKNPYFGALVGRYGNRIGGASFKLKGTVYKLAANNGPNSLHGGLKGFDKVVWKVDDAASKEGKSLALSYTSKDGEEGYPGNLTVQVTYTVTDSSELRIDYRATTDKPTVLNLTHHSYFNRAGAGKGNILTHELMLNADKFTPIDATLIPTGELRNVQGTPMDFRKPTTIGARIDNNDQQLKFGLGYDHNWILNKKEGELTLAARVFENTSGRVMEVYTTEPGIQFYSGNFLDGSYIGKGEVKYEKRTGFCLETQHFPDSPNKPKFPSTELDPGQTLTSTTIYKFSTQ